MQRHTLVAACYVRNSDPANKDSEVLKSQTEALFSYAAKMGYECPHRLVYADAISALKYPYWERPSLMRLWDDAERGEFDVVLCTEFIRLARKSSEQYAIMEYLKRFNVEVISITEKFEDTPEGRLLHAVQGFLGEVEAEKIRLRTLRGKQHRAEKALTGQGAGPVYGYEWVDGHEYKKERYVCNTTVIAQVKGVDITEVWVVTFCFESCLKGMSCRQIAFALTRMGIPTQRGKATWDRTTVRQIIKREAYTGVGYNGLWTRDPETNKHTDTNLIKLPEGIYPQIITPQTYEQAQQQLILNAQMSARNNKNPKESILRGMIFCGICRRRMHIKHFTKARPGRKNPLPSEYRCYRNEGLRETQYHHYISYSQQSADSDAWEFALPFIKNPTKLREIVLSMKDQVVVRDHSQDLEKEIERIKKSITSLYRLAEVADPEDDDGIRALQERLIALEQDKRGKEKLLHGVTGIEDKQEKLLTSLDRFEQWAETVRPFLDDPTYTISHEDKIAAFLILGMKVTVYPISEEYPDRIRYELFPPDIARFVDVCDCGFSQSSQWRPNALA